MFNQGLHSKKEFILLPYHKIIDRLVVLFYEKQYISSYKYLTVPVYQKGKRVCLTYISMSFNLYQDQSVLINKLKCHFKPSRKLYLTYKDLVEKQRKFPHFPLRLLLSTPKGFLWLHECIDFKVGGFLVFEIV